MLREANRESPSLGGQTPGRRSLHPRATTAIVEVVLPATIALIQPASLLSWTKKRPP